MNIPQKVYVVEAMRPDRDDWFPSRVFADVETAIRTAMSHEGHGKKPWVFRVVEFSRVREVEYQLVPQKEMPK